MLNENYGKIINGNLQYATNPIWVGTTMIANPTDEQYESAGFKMVVREEAPDLGNYQISFEETGSRILVKYIPISTETESV